MSFDTYSTYSTLHCADSPNKPFTNCFYASQLRNRGLALDHTLAAAVPCPQAVPLLPPPESPMNRPVHFSPFDTSTVDTSQTRLSHGTIKAYLCDTVPHPVPGKLHSGLADNQAWTHSPSELRGCTGLAGPAVPRTVPAPLLVRG